MLWLLPRFFQLAGVWWSMPASDFLASVTTALVMIHYMRKFKKQQVSNAQ
jgi:Na+-driven multidrug efflux pump